MSKPDGKVGQGMKQSSSSRTLCCVAWFGASVLSAAACERPDYTYSEGVAVVGTGAFSSFGGSFGSGTAGTFSSVGGTAPLDPCALDRAVNGAPIFAKQAVSNQLPVRPELYAQLTDDEVLTIKNGGSLLPPVAPLQAVPPLTAALVATKNASAEARKALLDALLQRFKTTRAIWPNPWALRLVDHPGTQHMNPVQVKLKKNAWVLRIFEGGQPTVVDVNNGIVSFDEATASPERIAAVYYVYDDRLAGNSTAQCESGRRELALGNEAMVESISIGTPEILERLNSDIDALTSFFNVVRPCASVERGSGTFRSFTVCQTWHFFDASTEYSAYQWALSSPMELYKPKTQNLASLIDALKDDRFDPAPFVTEPHPMPDGGDGGAGGAGGASDSAGGAGGASDSAGAAQGGSSEGGSFP